MQKFLQICTNLNACLSIKCVLPFRCQLIGADQRTSILVPVSVPQLNVTRSPACTTTNLSLTLKSRNTNNKFEFELKLSRSARDRCAILGVWDTRRALLQATTSKWHNLSSLTKWITVYTRRKLIFGKKTAKARPKKLCFACFWHPKSQKWKPTIWGSPRRRNMKGPKGVILDIVLFLSDKISYMWALTWSLDDLQGLDWKCWKEDGQTHGLTDRISAYRLDPTGENDKECIGSHALRQFDTESN